MATKKSVEGRIISYFRNASINEATLVFGIVKETMRERIPGKASTSVPVKKRVSKKKVNGKDISHTTTVTDPTIKWSIIAEDVISLDI